ncbi:radical SAM protein [Lentimonas sp. CC10]|uniref:radical SAM protein n=1 Tax=Lentimonas sp. CC10 TaxID=2676095 RepID=UPI001389AA34
MAKAIGPICNLDCKYCFYLEKEQFDPENEKWRMSDEKLVTFIRDYIAAQPSKDVSFVFQGGEPTLLGVDHFRKVVEFQKKHANGKTIETAFQTNGTLLDDDCGLNYLCPSYKKSFNHIDPSMKIMSEQRRNTKQSPSNTSNI